MSDAVAGEVRAIGSGMYPICRHRKDLFRFSADPRGIVERTMAVFEYPESLAISLIVGRLSFASLILQLPSVHFCLSFLSAKLPSRRFFMPAVSADSYDGSGTSRGISPADHPFTAPRHSLDDVLLQKVEHDDGIMAGPASPSWPPCRRNRIRPQILNRDGMVRCVCRSSEGSR